jgi:dephospho-CoA kinase
MIVIGLTGGMGTGKSEVSRILRELGAVVVDADKIGHEAYMPHTEAWQDVVNVFGREVLKPSGEIDRKRLGTIVFNDPSGLKKLNAIMHPRMYRMLEERIRELREQGVKAAVLEAAVLIEANWTPLVNQVWVVTSIEDEVVKRIQRRDDLSEEAIRTRLHSQLSEAQRSKYADVIIENTGDLAALRSKVESLWYSFIEEKTKGETG